MKIVVISFWFILYLLIFGCVDYTCDEVLLNLIGDTNGQIRIDTFYHKFGERGDFMADRNGNKILFSDADFLIKPMKGDSVIKIKGNSWYILIKKDSVYVEQWNCKNQSPNIIDSWEANDSFMFKKWLSVNDSVILTDR